MIKGETEHIENWDLNLSIKRQSAENADRLLHSATCYILCFVSHFLRVDLKLQNRVYKTNYFSTCL